MVTKLEAKTANVDWDKINKATEVRRTYLCWDKDGHEFYKMYKPSEAGKIFKSKGWHGKIVGVLDRSVRNKDDATGKIHIKRDLVCNWL